MKVIFLDVDGVLNASRPVGPDHTFELKNWVIPKCIDHLNRIVERTGAVVVVSSTWRIGKEVEVLREMFRGVGVQAEIFDKTERGPCSWHEEAGYTQCYQAHRGCEIDEWLRRHEVENFVILDDDSDLQPHLNRHVHTDLYRGLTRQKAEQAIRMLGGTKPHG